MNDIYNILSKHFLNEATEQEELQVAEFKSANKTEYEILKKLWESGDLKVTDFDSAMAWNTIQKKVEKRNNKTTKVVRLNTHLRQIAAVAAILIIGAFAGYYFIHSSKSFKTFSTVQTVQTAASVTERGKIITLADGSEIWLNRGATLTYPKQFNGTARNVELKGEAFFKVARNRKKPFIIKTENSVVKVLGTSFNVSSEKEKTEVTVATGTVKVTNSGSSKNVIIKKGFSAKVTGNEVEKFATVNPNYQSWRTGKFEFKNVEVTKVISELNRYYNRQLRIEGEAGNDCQLSAGFDHTKLEEVVEIIELACDIKLTIENKKP